MCAHDEQPTDERERLGDELEVRELRVQHRLHDGPADERLGRHVGLDERHKAERAEGLGKQASGQHDRRGVVDQVGRRLRQRLTGGHDLIGVFGEVRRHADGVVEEGCNQDQPHEKLKARPPDAQQQLDAHDVVERLEAAEEEALVSAARHSAEEIHALRRSNLYPSDPKTATSEIRAPTKCG